MGYTHFYKGLLWDGELAQAARDIIATSAVSICDGHGEGEPVVEDDIIWINGDGSKYEEYETFLVEAKANPDMLQFTKTERKPYDEVVTAILAYAALHEKDGWENICSDGDIIDWHDGIVLYERAFGLLSDQNIADLAEIVGWPDEWQRDKGAIASRKRYFASCSFRNDAKEHIASLYWRARALLGEGVSLDIDDEDECCGFLRTCSDVDWLTSWDDAPDDENCRLLADIAFLANSRWWESELEYQEDLRGEGWEWEFHAGEIARHLGIPEDIRSLVAGVPLKDVLA